MNERATRTWTTIGVFVAGAALAGAAVWAVGAVMRPADDPLEATDYTLVEVVQGEVGSSTPAFRDVGDGAKGTDVKQLQRLLSDLGSYHGPVGGEAGPVTAAAIRAWQKNLGVAQTGVVKAGDVVYVPRLPTRVTLDTKVVFRGATLSGGEQVVSGLPASPVFTVPVTDAQAAMIPAGTRVEISSPDGDTWEGYAGTQTRDETSGTVTIALEGADGAVICGKDCGQVPVTGQATLSSTIVTVETTSGTVVPSSALVSGADGQLALIGATGTRIPVSVLAAARGMSVVDGVDAGTKVRVPGEAGQ